MVFCYQLFLTCSKEALFRWCAKTLSVSGVFWNRYMVREIGKNVPLVLSEKRRLKNPGLSFGLLRFGDKFHQRNLRWNSLVLKLDNQNEVFRLWKQLEVFQ